MIGQRTVTLIATMLAAAGAVGAQQEGTGPYSEPAPSYLRQFTQQGVKVFIVERYDADGRLVARTRDNVDGDIAIESPIDRTIAGRKIRLRGLTGCPTETVVYNRVQTWSCVDAARDYAGTIYNRRASVILCKTMMLSPADGQAIPASCFLLVGGAGEPYRIVNDDDSMVFLGLAAIGQTPDGRSRRPDLEESRLLSRAMGFHDAD